VPKFIMVRLWCGKNAPIKHRLVAKPVRMQACVFAVRCVDAQMDCRCKGSRAKMGSEQLLKTNCCFWYIASSFPHANGNMLKILTQACLY